MSGAESGTLYANADKTRFYFVPDDADAGTGALVLTSLTGDRLTVDELEIEKFEIDEDEVRTRIRSTLSDELSGLGAQLQQADTMLDELKALADQGTAQADPEAEQRVADALGVDVESLRADPRLVMLKLQGEMAAARLAAQDGRASEEESRAEVALRVKQFAVLADMLARQEAKQSMDKVKKEISDAVDDDAMAAKLDGQLERLRTLSEELKMQAASIKKAKS